MPVATETPPLSANTAFTVGKIDAGAATLLGGELQVLQLPASLLPADATEGSVVKIVLERKQSEEERRRDVFLDLQNRLLRDFGHDCAVGDPETTPNHTSIRLKWNPVHLDPCDVPQAKWIITFNDEATPRAMLPFGVHEATICDLSPDTPYDIVLTLHSTSGQHRSTPKRVRTLSLSDFSPVVATFSLFDEAVRTRLTKQLEAFGARVQLETDDSVTHLVCRAPAGRRYEWACAQPHVHVVTAAWVESCTASGTLSREAAFGLDGYVAADNSLTCH